MESKDIRWVQRFQNFEKALHHLENALQIKNPRTAIKKAFETGLIVNGHDWMDLLLDRNLTAHTYDEEKATEVERLIHHKYFPLLKELFESLSIIKNEK